MYQVCKRRFRKWICLHWKWYFHSQSLL